MESNRKIAERLVSDILDNNIVKRTRPEMVIQVENQISWAMDDAVNIITNIENTSLNKLDRAARFIDLENKYGIPKTHLIMGRDD